MARWDPVLRGDPLGFEQGQLGETHENRIQGAGLEPRFAAQFIPIAPSGWALDEAFENLKSLWGESAYFHGKQSIYIDIVRQRRLHISLRKYFQYVLGV